MSDLRTLLATLGVALVTIGAGGYVSLRVGIAINGHPARHLSGVENVCFWTIGIGGGLILVMLLLAWRRYGLKSQIAACVLSGERLHARAEDLADGDDVAAEALRKDVDAWAKSTFEKIRTFDPAEAIHFTNPAGSLVSPGLVGDSLKSRIRIALNGYLTRLSELSVHK